MKISEYKYCSCGKLMWYKEGKCEVCKKREQHYIENETWQIWDGDTKYPLKENEHVMFKLDDDNQIVTDGPVEDGLNRERAELIVSSPAMKKELEKSVELMENLLFNYGYLMSFREKDTLQEQIKHARIALEGGFLR